MFKKQCLLYGPMDLLSFGCSVQWFTLRLFTEFNSVTLLIITRKETLFQTTYTSICLYVHMYTYARLHTKYKCLSECHLFVSSRPYGF